MLFHAIENDSRVQCSAFNGGEQFVLRGGLQIPAEGNATQVWIYQNRAVAVVPGNAQKAGLAGAIVFQSTGESRHVGSGARSNGLKNIADRRKTGLNAGTLRVHAALDNTAYSGNQTH